MPRHAAPSAIWQAPINQNRTKNVVISMFLCIAVLSFFTSVVGPSKVKSHGISNPPCSKFNHLQDPVTLQVIVPPRRIKNQQSFDISTGKCPTVSLSFFYSNSKMIVDITSLLGRRQYLTRLRLPIVFLTYTISRDFSFLVLLYTSSSLMLLSQH